MKYIIVPTELMDRLTDKDKRYIADKESELNATEDTVKRILLKDALKIITGGVVYEMSINKKVKFYKEFNRLSKIYFNVNNF